MTHKEFSDSLRLIADFYDRHEELPLPEIGWISIYDWGSTAREMVANAARAFGTCEKETNNSICYGVHKDFGSLRLRFVGGKEKICTKRIVGTKRVEAYYEPSRYIPEHEEEIVEWDCPESLLEPTQVEIDDQVIAVSEALTDDHMNDNLEKEEAPATLPNPLDSVSPDVDCETNKEEG